MLSDTFDLGVLDFLNGVHALVGSVSGLYGLGFGRCCCGFVRECCCIVRYMDLGVFRNGSAWRECGIRKIVVLDGDVEKMS